MSFSGGIKKFRDKAENAAVAIFQGTTLGMLGHIVKRTPVLSGRLRGNWQVTINKPATSSIDAVDKAGAKTIKKGKATIDTAKLGHSIFIINNLEYAPYIEHGTDKIPPHGMLKVTVAEYHGIVKKAVAKVK